MAPVLLLSAGCQYSGQTQLVTPIAAMPGPVPLALTACTDRTGATVAVITGEARLGFGGLHTIGAETYIVDAAAQDVARQLRDWARAMPAAPAASTPVPRA